MKSLFFIFLPLLSFAQLKIHSNGNISAKSDISPRGNFDIPLNSSEFTQGQFGTFGIQSASDGNGFLLANGYYSYLNGNGLYNYTPGAVPMIQFFDGKIILRNTISPTSANSLITQDKITHTLTTAYDDALEGIVGINTLNPSGYNLYVNGTAFKSSGGSTWAVPSDQRLKNNITAYSNALDIVKELKIYEFEYNGKAGTTRGEKSIGVLAQEISRILPSLVKEFQYQEYKEEKPNTYFSVESGSLIYILIAAIQEQNTLIDNLKLQLEEIKLNISNNNLTTKTTISD